MASLLDALEKAFCKLRRKRISKQIFEQNKGVVQYGPFKGLKLSSGAHTSAGTLGAKTCGLYEGGVIAKIMELGPYDDVVNFGAGDGYFSVGVLMSGVAKRSICFEMDPTGREAVARNGKLNNVADRVVIHGTADDTTGAQLEKDGFVPENALVLCDIEGAEFAVLSPKLLNDLAGATLIVELHDRLMPDGAGMRQALIDRLPTGAKATILKSAPPDWRDMPEIEALNDYDRQLVSTDGRKVLGEWLIVTY